MHISKVFCSFHLCSNMKLDDVKNLSQLAITRSKLTIETLEQGVKFDYVSHLVLLFLLLTLNMKLPAGYMQTFRFDSHDKHGK